MKNKCAQCGTRFKGNYCPKCGARAGSESPIPPLPVQRSQQMYQEPQQNYPSYDPVPPQNGRKGKKVKKKKPFFLRWWFILFVIIAIAVVASNVHDWIEHRIDWSEMILGDMIPSPPSKQGTVYSNSDEELRVNLDDVSDVQYNDYLQDVIEAGFTVDTVKDSYSYKAYNADGYSLNIRHYSESIKIQLDCPMELGTITWPDSAAGAQLPAPESTIGKFTSEHNDSFFVYVGDTTKLDYDEYVTICSDSGFTVDYEKDDRYYNADNAEGWHVSLKYVGNSVMSIDIDPPEEETPAPEVTAPPEEIAESEENTRSEVTTESENTGNASGLDPDFKAAMDSYEEFIDSYITFMESYSEDTSDLGLIAQYAKLMIDYASVTNDFESWEDEDLNDEETAYYVEVQTRVSMKLIQAGQ